MLTEAGRLQCPPQTLWVSLAWAGESRVWIVSIAVAMTGRGTQKRKSSSRARLSSFCEFVAALVKGGSDASPSTLY